MYGFGPIRAQVLAVRIIPRVNAFMKETLGLPDEHASLGMLTLTSDDVGYAAVDEATKKANVQPAIERPRKTPVCLSAGYKGILR